MWPRASWPRTSPTTRAAHLGVAGTGSRAFQIVTVTFGLLLDRPVLGPVHLGVDQHVVVVGVDPHHVAGDLAVGQVDAEGAEVGALAGEVADGRIEHGADDTCSNGASARPARTSSQTKQATMNQINVLGNELQPVLVDPLTGYYRTGCCENRGDDPGHARRVLPGHRRLPRVLEGRTATTCRRRCRSTASPG